MANPRTTQIALKEDVAHSSRYQKCYDIYISHRYFGFWWTSFTKSYKYVFAKCRGSAWDKAYAMIYQTDLYHGPDTKWKVR